MPDRIDCNARLSAEDHYRLYIYYWRLGGRSAYRDFNIEESLIESYNRADVREKQQIEQYARQDPNYTRFLQRFRETPWKLEKPVLWKDRKKTSYYIQQLKESHAFEVYIDWQFKQRGRDIGLYYGREQQYHMGETAAGIEIKYDKRSAETGNYYIEYQERMHDGDRWVNSGILKEDRTRFYLLGTIEKFVIFEREWLMGYYQSLVERQERLPDACLVWEKAHGTSKGFILKPAASAAGNISVAEVIRRL